MTRPKIWLQAAPQFITDLMKDFSLTPEQASGFPGNFAIESSFFTDIVEDGAIAKGWAGGNGWPQFTGMKKGQRRYEFEAWLRQMASHGYRANNYLGNYSMVYRELKGSEGRRVLPKLRACTTPEQAARVVCLEYERPASPSATMAKRQAAAREALDLWRKNPPPPTIWPTDKFQQEPIPMPTPTLPPASSGVLPSPKSAFNSRTIIAALATPLFTWLALKGFNLSPDMRDLVVGGVATVLPLAAAWFHSSSSRPVEGSPLGNLIQLSKERNIQNRVDINKMFEDQSTMRPMPDEAWSRVTPIQPDPVEYPMSLVERFRTAPYYEIVEHGPEIMQMLGTLFGGASGAPRIGTPPQTVPKGQQPFAP